MPKKGLIKLVKIIFFIAIIFLSPYLQTNINFGHRLSGITVNGGTLTFVQSTSNWAGTLDVRSGAIAGSPIFFNNGIYQKNNTAVTLQGSLATTELNEITLNTNKTLIADPAMPLGPLLVLGGGNILSGQPDFMGTTTLLNSFSELQININNKLGKSIAMNNGLVTLLNDLSLGDNSTLTGSGRINLNYKTLRLPAKETTWTSQLYFIQANDVILNAKTSLSGTWTFDGANAVLQGNGNILDLTAGGTLWIKSGADVEFTDIHVRGLGNIYGTIVFEDATSRIRLSNATLQLASNYSVTQGGIYVEGANSSIITGTSTLTLATGASMTVDRVTLFADALDATSTVNVSPNIPDGLTLIYKNNGILKAAGGGDNTLAIDNSNAIVGWIKDTSNAVAGLLVSVSNAVSVDHTLLVNTSNAVAGLLVDTSNAVNNLRPLVVANSDAIVGWIKDTSNSVNGLLVHTSNAVAGLLVDTSNAVNNLRPLAVNTSNAVNGLLVATSNAVAGLLVATSNAVVSGRQLGIDNSNAIIGWIADTSQAVFNFVLYNSQAIVTINTLNLANSYAIVSTNNLSVANSWAVIAVRELAVATSNALLANQTLDIETSNAVVAIDLLARANSAAIVGWIKDTSNAVAGLLVATSQAARWARSEADRANDSLLTVDHGPAHIHMSGAMTMTFDTYTSPDHQLRVHASGVLDGAGHAIKLGRSGTAIDIDAAVTVTLQNVVLKDYADGRVNIGAGSNLIFGQNVVLETAEGQSVTRTWTFAGYGIIKGNAEPLSLGNGQNYIVVLPNAGLTLKDIILTNVRDNNLRCMGSASSLTLQNAFLQLSSDYTFSSGSIAFASDVHLSGTSQFNYTTGMGSTVQSGASLNFEMGSKFNYAPSGNFKNLLVFANSTSQLRMTGCTLLASTTGCQLTKGTLIVDGVNYVQSSATNAAEAVVFGDGTPANDLIIQILPGAGLEVTSGFLLYNNVN